MIKKSLGIVIPVILGVIVSRVAGIAFGIVIFIATLEWGLKYFGTVPQNSSLISETRGIRLAKYILLAVAIIIIAYIEFIARS